MIKIIKQAMEESNCKSKDLSRILQRSELEIEMFLQDQIKLAGYEIRLIAHYLDVDLSEWI